MLVRPGITSSRKLETCEVYREVWYYLKGKNK